MDITSLMMTLCSLLSIVASLFMIYCLIRSEVLLKRTSFKIFLNMAISNILAAAGSVVGSPASGTAACWWEGIATNVFALSSLGWNVVLIYMFYNACHLKKVNMVYMHAVCWGLPAIVTIVPLAQVTYGNDSQSGGWCFLVDTAQVHSSVTLAIWYWVAYYMWIWLAFIIYLVFIIYLFAIFKYRVQGDTRELFTVTLSSIVWYPVVSMVCWGYLNFSDTALILFPNTGFPSYVVTIADSLGCLHGFFISVVFWFTTRASRMQSSRVSIAVVSSDEKLDHEDNPVDHDTARRRPSQHETAAVAVPKTFYQWLINFIDDGEIPLFDESLGSETSEIPNVLEDDPNQFDNLVVNLLRIF